LGMTVTVQGNHAYTDGKHINIPVLPENDQDSLIAVRGFLDHEAAHVRFTDMTVHKPEGFTGVLLNLLEDIRIEHRIAQHYPGSKQNLTDLADLLIRQGFMQLPDPDEKAELSPAEVFMTWLSLKLQFEKLNYPAVKEPFEEVKDVAQAVFPLDFLEKIAAITNPILQLPAVQDTLKMTQEIVSLFENYIEQQQQQAKESSADSESAQEGQSASDSPSDDSGSDQKDQSAVVKRLKDVLNSDGSDLDKLDKGKAVSQLLSEKSENLSDNNHPIVIPETVPASRGEGISLETVLGTSSKLRTRLAGMIQASRLKRSYPRQSGRRLDTRFINRIPMSDLRIFTSKYDKKAVNTAVLILIDRSGSMAGRNKMEVARESALAAAIGVDSIPGATVCVGSFPTGYDDGVIEVLPFEQKPRQKFQNFGVSPSGGTPMTEAIWWGTAKLLARKEPRKLMIVATDGEANDPDTAKAAIDRVTKSGIEVMGLGIQHHAVQYLFDESCVIQTVEEMPAALIGMLQGKLQHN